MTTVHNLGFPRIGAHRELKFALESYWKGDVGLDTLTTLGAHLRQQHWQAQADLDLAPVGDFSFTTRCWTPASPWATCPSGCKALAANKSTTTSALPVAARPPPLTKLPAAPGWPLAR